MSVDLNSPVIPEGLPVTFRDLTVWRPPEDFYKSVQILADFDEKWYTTFISNGNGVAVHEAYKAAIESVLGSDARKDFSEYHGLSNRAPLDVIEGLISREPVLIDKALNHARDYFASPKDVTDIGLAMIARFANRGKV